MNLKLLIGVLALTAVTAVSDGAQAKDKSIIVDPTMIPNCEAIGGDMIIMAPGLYACCFEGEGCWICDARGECEFDEAYVMSPIPGTGIYRPPEGYVVADPSNPWREPLRGMEEEEEPMLPGLPDRAFEPVDLPDFAVPFDDGMGQVTTPDLPRVQ